MVLFEIVSLSANSPMSDTFNIIKILLMTITNLPGKRLCKKASLDLVYLL